LEVIANKNKNCDRIYRRKCPF